MFFYNSLVSRDKYRDAAPIRNELQRPWRDEDYLCGIHWIFVETQKFASLP